jgi:hypothetical protein
VCVAGNCQRFAPAASCNTCPCDTVCQALTGNTSACCAGIGAGAPPICISGTTTCPCTAGADACP